MLYGIGSVARNFQLRLGTSGANGKNRVTFDGFLRDDFERLSNLCKQVRCPSHARRRALSLTMTQYYNTTLETKETSVKGWNWGVAEVQCASSLSPSPTSLLLLSSTILTAPTTHSARFIISDDLSNGLHDPHFPRPQHLHHETRSRARIQFLPPARTKGRRPRRAQKTPSTPPRRSFRNSILRARYCQRSEEESGEEGEGCCQG